MAGRPSWRRPTHASWTTTAGRGPKTGKSISRKAGISRTTKFFQRKYSIFSNKESEAMKTQFLLIAAGTLVCTALFVTPASSHHSFAMYDQEKTLVMTGVMKQFV